MEHILSLKKQMSIPVFHFSEYKCLHFNRVKQVPCEVVRSNKQWVGTCLYQEWYKPTPDKLRSSYSVMKYHKEGPACGRIPYDPASSEADCEYPLSQLLFHCHVTGIRIQQSSIRIIEGNAYRRLASLPEGHRNTSIL